jgi:ATP-binding cassette subfamily B protein IrtA
VVGMQRRDHRALVENISGSARVRGSALSGGILQSIALARAFLRADVDLIVVDEAMGAMDAVKKHRVVLPNLVAFARERKAALVMVTHDVGSVCPMVDEVVLLEKGRLAACGQHDSLVAANVRAYKDLLLSPHEADSDAADASEE